MFYYPVINFYFKALDTGYFDLIYKGKDLNSSSSNLIISYQAKDRKHCLGSCNQNMSCKIVIYNSNGLCTLCKPKAISDLVNSTAGQTISVYRLSLR